MYKNIVLLTVALTTFSCDSGEKTKKDASLLDIGFIEEETSELKSEVGSLDLFKGHSGRHYGMDISNWQGDILSAFKSMDSLKFIICKATQGTTIVDPDFRNNWNMINQKGLIRGAYHFYDCKDDPTEQANHFVSQISDINLFDIAPILDIEQGSMTSGVSGDQMEKDIKVFLNTVEKKLGRKPIIYTDYIFAQQYFKDPTLADYDLWLAEWTSAQYPRVPDLWKQKGFKIWQKSASYDVYSKVADLDEYIGILRDLVE